MTPRYIFEIKQLRTLQRVLNNDVELPLRFDIQPLGDSFDLKNFQMTIRGVEGLIARPGEPGTDYKVNSFTVTVYIQPGHPYDDIPKFTFLPPILFHPNVYRNGEFCWGQGNKPSPSRTLKDWFLSIVEYIQYDPRRVGIDNPANTKASDWWKENGSIIHRYIRLINLERLRNIIQQIK